MPIYPRAVYRRPPGMTVGPRRTRTDAVIWHVDAGGVRDLYGWWNQPGSGQNGSHFHVAQDGTVFQYADTDHITYTSGAGSRRSIGIETQGKAAGEWTPAQATALVDLTRWLCDTHNIPVRAMSSSKTTERGIGWHTLGVPATQAQKSRGVSQTGGELWSSSVGKVCPGPDRVRQIPGLIARIGGTPAGPTPPTSEEDEMTPAQMTELKAHQSAEANRIRDELAAYVTGNEKGKGTGQVTTRALYDQTERFYAREEQIHAWDKTQRAATEANLRAAIEKHGVDPATVDAILADAIAGLEVTLAVKG